MTKIQNMFFKAKKSLGQNFLHSTRVVIDMCRRANLDSKKTVVEIGPGKGILTRHLLEKAGKVITIEKDDRLINELRGEFKDHIDAGKLNIVHDDALAFNPESHNLEAGGYKIVANIPYYITGAFFKHFLSHTNHPDSITVLIQREVAHRILARDSKESLLSIGVKAYGEPWFVTQVGRENFTPQPNVDSAVLHIERISKKLFKDNQIDENHFFETVKAGFAHKRKRLGANIGISEEILYECGLDPNVRAEELSIADWIALCKSLLTISRR